MTFRQQISAAPSIHHAFWSFAMTGRVRHPVVWSYDDLTALPMQATRSAIICSAGKAAKAAVWRGVPVSTLLADVQIEPDAKFALVHSADGYTTVISRKSIEAGLLVTEVDGNRLTVEDGAPARLILPGKLGFKQAKWIERIEWVAQPAGGLWEDRGYDLEGQVSVGIASMAVSMQLGTVEISGQAYASHNLHRVFVSIDSGSWMPATLQGVNIDDAGVALSDWSIRWTPPHPGDFSAQVRAEAANGDQSRILTQKITAV